MHDEKRFEKKLLVVHETPTFSSSLPSSDLRTGNLTDESIRFARRDSSSTYTVSLRISRKERERERLSSKFPISEYEKFEYESCEANRLGSVSRIFRVRVLDVVNTPGSKIDISLNANKKFPSKEAKGGARVSGKK